MVKQIIEPTEEQIRERAYYLWEIAGCPKGRDQEFWFMAKEELEIRRFPAPDAECGKIPGIPKSGRKRKHAAKPVSFQSL